MRRLGDNAGMASGDSRAQVQLDEDTLARRRRVLGEDHPDTLAAASNLAISLRAVGGHPDTLTSAFHLAADLAELGEYQAAKELNEDILDRRRRVLGDRHPDTMGSAAFALILSGLAADPKTRALMETMKAAWSQPGEGREPDS
jgi:Tetratricopeptide repeat